MLNIQNFALVGADSLGGFLRWALFIILAVTAIILLISKTKIAKKSVGPAVLVLTILAAPFLLITTVEKTVKPESKTVSSEVNRPDLDIPKTNKGEEAINLPSELPKTDLEEKPGQKEPVNNAGRGSSSQTVPSTNNTPSQPDSPTQPEDPIQPDDPTPTQP